MASCENAAMFSDSLSVEKVNSLGYYNFSPTSSRLMTFSINSNEKKKHFRLDKRKPTKLITYRKSQ